MELYHDKVYLDLVKDILENGVVKPNRTGMDTIAVFSRQLRFDLSGGSIPLLTTKKMHTRSIIHELLWYLQGNTSSQELERNNVTIWQEWKDQNDELGKIYGHQWRSWDPRPNEVIYVESRIVDKHTCDFTPPTFELTNPEISKDLFVGSIFSTKECGDVVVLRLHKKGERGDHTYDVQFIDTGYTKQNVRKSTIKRGHIIDVYKPRVYGVGYLGEYDKTDPNLKIIQRHWYKILERCYDQTIPEYQLYGGNGIFIHPRWHCFAKFQRDIKYIPNWNNKRLKPSLYELDKDYYSSNCYSKNTCVWLTSKHNTLYRKNPRKFEVITPDGDHFDALSVDDVCNEYGLTKPLVYKVLHGKYTQHKKFQFKYTNGPEKVQPRYRLPIDQVAQIIDKLRNNPNDRRMIISSWNVGELDQMALPPCHYAFQFYVADGKLSCMLNQRSCDVGLGVPFNIVQYSILTHMFAQVTNLEPGEFIWNGGDVHIYKNHVDQLESQLIRRAFPSPMLKLNPNVTEIDNFIYDDFEIVGYQHHPLIKMEVSV